MRWALPLLAIVAAGAVSVWGALYALPWVTAVGGLSLLAVLGAHLAVNERDAPSGLRLMLGAGLVLLAGAVLVKVSGWQANGGTLNIPGLAALAEDFRMRFQREATIAGFQSLAWMCLAVSTGWLLRRRPPFGVGAVAIVAGMAMLAGAAAKEAELAWNSWHWWQELSAEAGRQEGILVSISNSSGPDVGAGVLVGAALLGTTMAVLACAWLSRRLSGPPEPTP